MTVTDLRDALADDLAAARGELADHERELYDRTLTEGLRRHLVGRIRRATELTQRINRQLRKVETEAGVAVQLEWVVGEHGEAVAQARPLLLKDPADLREDERDALHGFLRARIDLVRDPDDSDDTSWEGRLLRAFDYRAWHTFRLKVSHQAWGREFRPATAKRLQQLSTGERSVVLHLPMLASIAAHYDAGEQERGCPRLILLDELFVGVDPINRAQLFGMFVEWDLDAVLTSDHEWCRYASLDGIAIHQVHADADPVVTTRFVWDGHRKQVAAVHRPGDRRPRVRDSDVVGAGLPPALVARADRPGLTPLWTELARRLGASDRPVRRVQLTGLDTDQREALADLLGLASLPSADPTVPVEQVCRSLRIDEPTLRRLVERLQGPLDNRSARRAAEMEARRRLWEEVEAAVAGRGLDGWVARLRAAGSPTGTSPPTGPGSPRCSPSWPNCRSIRHAPLALVAQRHLGDPHALDQGTWAGAVVADAAAALAGLATPVSAEQARTALSRSASCPTSCRRRC
jgi:hypothetical protein